ncbi:MAG: sigma-54 interaction domain-containing protein [Terriglobales bacterium]
MATPYSIDSRSFQSADQLPPIPVIIGKSKRMQEIWNCLQRAAASNLPVLICGESGTGKDLIARLIHLNSPRSRGPLVKVTCPAIPGPLLESELFGYEKGAFTGANGSKRGRFELAQSGTLFLDEIAELELALQAKLLHVLQEGQFCRLGALEDTKVDVRVVCATNRHLADDIAAGTFRQDLFYRINVVNLELCPLRERIDDLPDLASYLIDKYNEKFNQRAAPLSRHLMLDLQRHAWPGNIRELENLIQRYVVYGSETAISRALAESSSRGEAHDGVPRELDLPSDGSVSLKSITKQAMLEVERRVILKSLQSHDWNRKRTAQALRISYRALLYKIRDAGLPSRSTTGVPTRALHSDRIERIGVEGLNSA